MSTTEFLSRCQPPWIVFPAIEPQTLPPHLKQGEAEPWFDQQWRPFWASLTEQQKAQYLDYWNASQDWREAIAFFFDHDWAADAAADAAESEQQRQQQPTPAPRTAKKPSLLSRWFGRKL